MCKNRAKRLRTVTFGVFTLILREKPLKIQIIAYSEGSSDVRILYNGLLFYIPIIPAGSFNESLIQIGNSFLHPEYFSVITVNNKALSNESHLINIHKSISYKALESNADRILNTGTTLAISILT